MKTKSDIMITIINEIPGEIRQVEDEDGLNGNRYPVKLQQKWTIHWHSKDDGGVKTEWRDIPTILKEEIEDANK